MKTIVQIGTNYGYDEFREYCNNLKERYTIILIDANKNLEEKARECYNKLEEKHNIIYMYGVAVVPDSEEESHVYLHLLEDDNDIAHALGSLINRQSYALNKKILIPAKKINKLIEELDIKYIEELHIDTEGLDYELLLSLDIHNYSINKIVCEMWPFKNDDLNGRWKTGQHLLNEIKSKYNNYEISEIYFSNMKSLQLIKK